jgi:hypothetical protein
LAISYRLTTWIDTINIRQHYRLISFQTGARLAPGVAPEAMQLPLVAHLNQYFVKIELLATNKRFLLM